MPANFYKDLFINNYFLKITFVYFRKVPKIISRCGDPSITGVTNCIIVDPVLA
jgi:hypothetical protein